MIEWLDEIAKMIAETSSTVDHPEWPDVPTRLGEATIQDVIDNRIHDQHFEDDELEVATAAMPYFVIRPSSINWVRNDAQNNLRASGVVEVTFFEHTKQYPTEPTWSANKKHREAHRYFASDFTDPLIHSLAMRQGKSPYRLPFEIEVVTPPYRTPFIDRDPDNTQTDFFQQSWDFKIHVKP